MRSKYRDLVAYRLSREFADGARSAVAEWTNVDRWTVGTQLIRSADSIGANIAEAYGRQTTADRRRLLYIARGSLLESEHWVAVAQARSLMLPVDANHILGEIARTLNGLLRKPGRRD